MPALPIHPLPQFEADLKEHLQEKEDREAYEKLNAPTSIVARFGYLKMVGEFPYSGEAKPGCGSKLVVRTHRGTEIGEMLTSTCPNSGCSKSVSRKEMLEYIENSGGKQYPFHDNGRVLRIATPEDLNDQERIEQRKNELRMVARRMVEASGLPMHIIEAEPLLGGERVVIYFGADERVDFRQLVQDLQSEIGTKVELRQIGARDEARITADYERCGQYCCCKNFLKVLKPVSMKSAKVQKATLDPLKISGRCGRLMCCLRYEDETYEELRKNLPHRKSRVGTPDGDGTVISTQILTQLALIRLDDGNEAAYPVENLTPPDSKTPPEPDARAPRPSRPARPPRGTRSARDRSAPAPERGQESGGPTTATPAEQESDESEPTKKRRRRKKKRTREGTGPNSGGGTGGRKSPSDTDTETGKTGKDSDQTAPRSDNTGDGAGGGAGDRSDSGAGEGARPKKKKRRRRRRGGEGGGDGGGGSDGPASPGDPS